ncbi:uncharacterized protein LOC105686917 isoform X2 [Athalia rosae]|uniref:uncharacterized protein LOC105686917 isoform X2 n=1 Tax=Athalia rosae TaxID=37344 RepID=UPI0020347A17|nr:uncharacterized protein LOC105686917 isoform X2 [Athalia rosae]
MESLSAPDPGHDMAREESRLSAEESVETGLPTTLGFAEAGNPHREPSETPELRPPSPAVNSKKRPAPADFLPIKTEIKKMGVEISDERAEQLKNDIRRLSPEVVSLRERTLGEISLTPDSAFFEIENIENQNACDKPEGTSLCVKETINGETNAPDETSTVKSITSVDESAIIEGADNYEGLSRVNGDIDESTWWSNTTSSRGGEGVARSSVNCDSEVVRGKELQLMISRDGDIGGDNDSVRDDDICVDGRTEPETSGETLNPGNSDDEIVVKNSVNSDSNDAPTVPKAVIQKLEEGVEIVFNSVNVSHVIQSSLSSSSASSSTSSSSSSSSSPGTNGLAFLAVYPESSSCSSTENVEDPLRDRGDTETDSDGSEATSIQSSLNPMSDIDPLSLGGDQNDLSSEIAMSCTRIMEPEQPEAFTEDSAESLALVTGTRDEVRSDGSDSGLGGEIVGDPGPTPAPESDSETSFLDRIPDEILSDKDKDQNQLDGVLPENSTEGASALMHVSQSLTLSEIPLPARRTSFPKSNLKRRPVEGAEGEPILKKLSPNRPREKKNIQFDAVTVYYFARAQGFTCVPSQGGSTLGMEAAHIHAERFTLTEHAAEQRRIHRARLAELRSKKAANNVVDATSSSEDPSDEEEEASEAEDLEIDGFYFLLPVPTWQRRSLLRASGVPRIETEEKDECRQIRTSRKQCGCSCKGYCDPESCPCSSDNVKCQVDRAGFPCGCSRDGCANSSGRIEFNPVRVRTHFIHTLMRLELETKNRADEDCADLLDLDTQPGVQGPLRDPTRGITIDGYSTNNQQMAICSQPEIPGTREDSLDLYTIRDEDAVDSGEQSLHHRKFIHPSEFSQVFQPFPGTGNNGDAEGLQHYPQTSYHPDYHQAYQTLPSTSRGQFHPQFSQYGYGPESSSSSTHHHQQSQNYGDTYQQNDLTASSQYTNLNSVQQNNHHHHHHHNVMQQQQVGTLEPFSEILSGRYS